MTDSTASATVKSERLTQFFLLFALFTVPFATALTNASVVLCYLSFLATLAVNPALRRAPRNAPAILALVLLGLFVLGASWSIAPPHEILGALKKYSKLLLLPLAITLSWRDPTLAPRALRAFMAGAAILALSCYLVRLDLMPTNELNWWRIGNGVDSYAFKNHITVGILLGFAAMVCFLKASYPGPLRARLTALACGVLFGVPIIFLTQGRTGYVVLFIGLVTLLVLRVRTSPLRLTMGLAVIVAMFFSFYSLSENFKFRTDQLVSDVQSYKEANPRTANGLRLSFIRVGTKVIAEHPLVGIGTGSFAEVYAPTARALWPEGHPEYSARNHAHGEFLGVAVQLGLMGLVVFVGMLAALGRAALRRRTYEADAMLLLWIIYVSTSVYNSLLWDPTEANWFLMLAGCLYAFNMRREPVPQVAPVRATA